MAFTRRDFVKFVGGTCVTAGSIGGLTSALSGCSTNSKSLSNFGIAPSNKDDLVLADGLFAELLIGWGDPITSKEKFGFNCDYTAFFSINKNEALLWVNHEYPHKLFVSGEERSLKNIKLEQESVGGSIVHIKLDSKGKWRLIKNSKFNRRLDGATKIPFAAGKKVQGKSVAMGTLSNCAGGVTPWGTLLTCEENYQDYYGDVDFKSKKRTPSRLSWDKYFSDNHPYQYGWVVEVDMHTGESKKHTSMGRFAHECATCIKAKDGRTVVYTGDDKADEFVYKFISEKEGSLDKGTLYVANIEQGKWLSLDINKSDKLKKTFKDQLDVLIHCREAGKILGATPLDRPEDFEIQEGTNNIFLTLTNNKKRGNYHGSILKIIEKNNDPLSLEFSASEFAGGGKEGGFSCPDNLIFDKSGNLWMVTDMSGSAMNKTPYTQFKNNGLFYFPMSGPDAGKAIQIASAPNDAELTGLTFSSDNKTLFISVQHPGEKSKSLDQLTSTWPHEAAGIPRPSVVQVQGPLLDRLISI